MTQDSKRSGERCGTTMTWSAGSRRRGLLSQGEPGDAARGGLRVAWGAEDSEGHLFLLGRYTRFDVPAILGSWINDSTR